MVPLGIGLIKEVGYNCAFNQVNSDSGLAQISGYVHVKNICNITEAGVKTWISDDLIRGEMEWRPLLSGKLGDWTLHPLIKSIVAACDGGTRRLEGGQSSGAVHRGGRPGKASQPADGGGGAAETSIASANTSRFSRKFQVVLLSDRSNSRIFLAGDWDTQIRRMPL